MKFAAFEVDETRFAGVVKGDVIIKLSSLASNFNSGSLLPLISDESALPELTKKLNSLDDSQLLDSLSSGNAFKLSDVKIRAPMRPPAVFCLGFNYRAHTPELNRPVPEVPVIFMKPSFAVIGPDEDVVLPKVAKRVDYEVELAIVIGRGGRYIPYEEAYNRVFGYTILNDITARDIQRYDFSQQRPWLRSKGFDTFAPLGPFVVPRDEVDPMNLELKMTVNGVMKQHARSSQMLFDIPKMVEYISSFTTLEPGSVIATGTPENIGPLNKGDLMEAYVEGIGTLRNRAIGEI